MFTCSNLFFSRDVNTLLYHSYSSCVRVCLLFVDVHVEQVKIVDSTKKKKSFSVVQRKHKILILAL